MWKHPVAEARKSASRAVPRRQLPPPLPLPLPRHATIVERPPFTLASELALFRRHRIDTLVTKQSGGPTEAKLAAAREAGAEVIVVRRPPPPPGMVAPSVAEALGWLRQA